MPFRAEALLAGLLLAAAPAAAQQVEQEQEPLGLFGTIPLYWGEADGMADVLSGGVTPHWARTVLERDHPLVPLATVTQEALAPLHLLLIAQPRVLSPQENVALDAWVRGGGWLLLFADPLLTAESRYPLGDPRRPQDVVLLSPLLGHWGLQLLFDAGQPSLRETREIAGLLLPRQLAGHFAVTPESAGCVLQDADILAECSIGAGRATIVADATVLDTYHPPAAAQEALTGLLARAFGPAKALEIKGSPAGADEPPVDKAVQNPP